MLLLRPMTGLKILILVWVFTFPFYLACGAPSHQRATTQNKVIFKDVLCINWAVLKVSSRSATWMEYLIWYGVRFGWNPEQAWNSYQHEDDRWKEFVRLITSSVVLKEMGMIPPDDTLVDPLVESLRRDLPQEVDEDVLREIITLIAWVSVYRDQTFRFTLMVEPERIEERFQQRRKENPDITLDQVYEDIYQEILDEMLPQRFREWQDGEVQRLKPERMLPPEFCQTPSFKADVKKASVDPSVH